MIAVVPAKALGAAKSRLLPQLGREAVARLARAMLADLRETLGQGPALSRVAVVTPDGELAEAARAAANEILAPRMFPIFNWGATTERPREEKEDPAKSAEIAREMVDKGAHVVSLGSVRMT